MINGFNFASCKNRLLFMKPKAIILISPLSFIYVQAIANDSTFLEKRINKIKALAARVALISSSQINYDNRDSVVLRNKYSKVAKEFFANPSGSLKYDLIQGLVTFGHILRRFPVDSMILKMPDPLRDTFALDKKHAHYKNNTIILYFAMYALEFEGMYFAFKKRKTRLLHIIEAGGLPSEFRDKKKFLNSLN